MKMETPDEVKISFRIQPGAPKNAVVGLTNGVWKVRIAAPPVEGKANRELIEFLSEVLDVPKSCIAIVKGETGRDKVVSITGLTLEEIDRRLGDNVKS
jgi:uncharacterized protein (TIGR00251 family)